jgi:hypothetical protein
MRTIYKIPAYINFASVVIAIAASTAAASSEEIDSYQQNALFHPSVSQLTRESRGLIYIYDGLTHETIDKAMDNQPDRIESMMFVNTKKTDKTGEVPVEDDDDC